MNASHLTPYSQCLNYTKATHSVSPPSLKQFEITTSNLGLLPEVINLCQSAIAGLANHFSEPDSHRKDILPLPSNRISGIIAALLRSGSPVICTQELFDEPSTKALTTALSKAGYNVVSNVGQVEKPTSFSFFNHLTNLIQKNPIVNSGLFLASKYPIDQRGLRFYQFTNLTGMCNKTRKGVLRVPLQIDTQRKVIIYVSHLQATSTKTAVEDRKTRSIHLQAILSHIQADQRNNPSSPIFFVGDLNVTDVEEDGSQTNEYTSNATFFNHFQNCFLFDHDQTGQRTHGAPQFLEKGLPEPDGSFYDLARPLHPIVSQCLYDYVLLFKNGSTLTNIHTELRHLMRGGRSDHLPLTMVADLTPLFTSNSSDSSGASTSISELERSST